jgi:hypothetical protein
MLLPSGMKQPGHRDVLFSKQQIDPSPLDAPVTPCRHHSSRCLDSASLGTAILSLLIAA